MFKLENLSDEVGARGGGWEGRVNLIWTRTGGRVGPG